MSELYAYDFPYDFYVYGITALLPLSACILVFQVNPYHALVIRGILGGVAALVYAVLGGADVALTEALVGTMLAITLYAVAVRSSMVMRMGVVQETSEHKEMAGYGGEVTTLQTASIEDPFQQFTQEIRRVLWRYHLRLELVPYADLPTLQSAFADREIHAFCVGRSPLDPDHSMILPVVAPEKAGGDSAEPLIYHTTTRIQRLYDILRTDLSSPHALFTYVDVASSASAGAIAPLEQSTSDTVTDLEGTHP
jgi:putative multicomponent Na+:H+ antiporter subunit B